MATWVICAGELEAERLCEYVRSCDASASVVSVGDPCVLRRRLRSDLAGSCVIVGEGFAGPDPVNVAAAIVRDGTADEVILALESTSGSMRSRARRAGVTSVLTHADLAARQGSTAVRAQGDGHARVPGPAARGGDASQGEAVPREPAPRRANVPVIVLVSGRGGVGKSTLAAMFGHAAAGWGLDVALLDLDLAFGNLASLCGAERPGDLASLAAGVTSDEELERSGVRVAERLAVWGPCRAPEYAETVQPVVADVIARLTHAHDLVIVDTSSNWGDAVACAAQMADRLVIVSDERPGAIPALARCGSLAVRLGVARTRIVRLMNGCDPRRRDESFVARAAVGLECAREVRVLDGGLDLVELASAGECGQLSASGNPAAQDASRGLAGLLKELGALPECEAAHAALEGAQRRRRLFGLPREAS